MESPPQFVIFLVGVLVVCSGPILLAGGILAYTGRWTAWAGPTSYPLASKHSRLAFMAFWAGLPLTGADIIIEAKRRTKRLRRREKRRKEKLRRAKEQARR